MLYQVLRNIIQGTDFVYFINGLVYVIRNIEVAELLHFPLLTETEVCFHRCQPLPSILSMLQYFECTWVVIVGRQFLNWRLQTSAFYQELLCSFGGGE